MRTRKLVLLIGIALLACAYILQTINAHRSPVKAFTLKESPDAITISSASNGDIVLTKIGDKWLTNSLPADENRTYLLTSALQNIKTLGTVSRSNTEDTLQRYGLDDMTKITITATKNGSPVRTLELGKAATNAEQTYIRIDGSDDILIASGNLHGQFDVTADDLIDEPEDETEESQSEAADAPAAEA